MIEKMKISVLIKCLVFLACAFALMFSVAFATIDDEIRQRELEKEHLLQIIDEINASLNENRKFQEDVNIKIINTNLKLGEIEREINDISDKIATTEDEIRLKEKEVAELNRLVDEKQELLNKRLRVMYKEGSVGYLEVLLGSDSLEELLSRADILQTIVKSDQDMIVELEDAKALAQKKKEELAAKKEHLAELLGQKIVKKEEQEALLADLHAYSLELIQDEEALQEAVAIRAAEQAEIDRIIERLELSKLAYVGGDFIWPVPSSYRITSPFGYRPELAYLGAGSFHNGMDIGANWGEDVLAAQSGTVVTATTMWGYGNVLMIDHGGGMVTVYGHLSEIYVSQGQDVQVGDVVAAIGSTGISTGPHLHFEVRDNGERKDPMEYVGQYVR